MRGRSRSIAARSPPRAGRGPARRPTPGFGRQVGMPRNGEGARGRPGDPAGSPTLALGKSNPLAAHPLETVAQGLPFSRYEHEPGIVAARRAGRRRLHGRPGGGRGHIGKPGLSRERRIPDAGNPLPAAGGRVPVAVDPGMSGRWKPPGARDPCPVVLFRVEIPVAGNPHGSRPRVNLGHGFGERRGRLGPQPGARDSPVMANASCTGPLRRTSAACPASRIPMASVMAFMREAESKRPSGIKVS